MALVDDLARTLDRWSIRHGRLLVAVSGGADSIALLHALHEVRPVGLELICAHVNHELRPEAARFDARFVEREAERLSLPFRVVTARPDATLIRDRGVEAAARTARYRALQEIRRDTAAGWIATAHTMDDQAETVLLRLASRASVETLRAILPITPDGIVRPLLETRRQELREWLRMRSVEHTVDASNEDLRFLRNRIRHLLVPKLESLDEQIVPSLARIAAHVRRIQEILEPVRRASSHAWIRRGGWAAIAIEVLPESPALRRILLLDEIRRLAPRGRSIRGERLEALIDELRVSPRLSLGDGVEASLDSGQLVLELRDRRHQETLHFSVTLHPNESVWIPEIGARVAIRPIDQALSPTQAGGAIQVFALPHPTPSPSFIVRNRRPGDRFHPLGMSRAKKLKSFLIDRKIPREARDRLPMLLLGEEIIWIAGVEISHPFRIAPGRDLYEVRIDYAESAISEKAWRK